MLAFPTFNYRVLAVCFKSTPKLCAYYLAATLYASRIGDSIYNSDSKDWNDGLKNAKAPKALGTHTDAMKESVKKINWNVELAKIKQNYSLNEMPSEKN